MSSPELSVVCKSCGSEISPYVTECPYCGTRVRKRAPKLRRDGDELRAKEPRRAKRRRAREARRAEAALGLGGERRYATIAAILGPAVLLVVQRAAGDPLTKFGAIVGPVDSDWWRYLAAPFAYTDVGYLFVVAVAIALFAGSLEERFGTPVVLLLIVATGALGMIGAEGIETAVRSEAHITVAAGGNGTALGVLAAWFAIRRAEARRIAADDLDLVGVAVVAAVLLLLPVVEDWANPWAGLIGGAVGGLAGISAALASRGAAAR